MNKKPWLRQVLADAKADRASWPDWAKTKSSNEGLTSRRRAMQDEKCLERVPQKEVAYSQAQ
jgi:hypothetical protein